MRARPFYFVTIVGLLASTGCSDNKAPPPEVVVTPAASRAEMPMQLLSAGGQLFLQHCAQCHGPQGQGHPDWLTPNDGSFAAAPPLDGTGTDRNRTKPELVRVIKQGVHREVDVMPAYGGRLSDEEIEAVIAWFQSLWPADVYAVWARKNAAPTTP